MKAHESGLGVILARCLAIVILLVSGVFAPASPMALARTPDGCERIATTGRSFAGRQCDGAKSVARVDNRASPHVVRSPAKHGERPIDRLRSRGEGAPEVIGDKGAKRQSAENRGKGRGRAHRAGVGAAPT